MPKVGTVGASPSTAIKHDIMDALAGHLLGSAARIAQRWRTTAVVIDETCGNGVNPVTGQPGSPIIYGRHVAWLREHGSPIDLICVDRSRQNIEALQSRMQARYPDLPVRYETDQRAALESLSKKTYGLACFDPTHYRDLDEDLLEEMGQEYKHLDILFTRQGRAYKRMQGARHTAAYWGKDIEYYLRKTGKDCLYLAQYDTTDWWSFGFADNWVDRPKEKLKWPGGGQLFGLDTPQGRITCARWKRERETECGQLFLPGLEDNDGQH